MGAAVYDAAYHAAYYAANRDRKMELSAARRVALRREVIEAYGGVCTCCGEDIDRFLTIDHTNDDGAEHRLSLTSSQQLWLQIRREGFPDRYRIQCFNCNCGRALNGGVCPHETKG